MNLTQLNLLDNLNILEDEGFTVRKTFKSSNGVTFKKLESTRSIILDESVVLYVQDNGDGTYNTAGFNHEGFNVSLKEVVEIVKNKSNWCLQNRRVTTND